MAKVISMFQVVERENEVMYNYKSKGTLESHLHRIFTDAGYYNLLSTIEIQVRAIRKGNHPKIVSEIDGEYRYTIATLPRARIDPDSGMALNNPEKEIINAILSI